MRRRKPSGKIEGFERRRFARFSSSIFLGIPVRINPLPPYFGETATGVMEDLSAGGMAIRLDEHFLPKSKLHLELTFPDRSKLISYVVVRRSVRHQGAFHVGLEFINLPDYMEAKINKISADYNDCEKRIRFKEEPACFMDCSFFTMCNKKEKQSFVKSFKPPFIMNFEEPTQEG